MSVHRKYILIYIQQDATLNSLFISGKCSVRFLWYLHPSSGTRTTVSTASGTYQTVTATCRYRGRVGTGLSQLNFYRGSVGTGLSQFQLFHDSDR
jgi:hypothetical protein